MERLRTALLVSVLVAGMLAFLASLGGRESEVVRWELALGFALRVVGGLVAVVGLVGTLGQWHAGAGAARLAGGGAVVLAGVTVASQSWAAALGLAVVLAAALALPRGRGPDAESSAPPDRGGR